ncbi:MAG: hypothetical protein AB2L20_05440 [Mangrovibacterium sp.]
MASIRQLKKDVDDLISQVVIDCFRYNRITKRAHEEATHQIIDEVLVLGGELLKRVNRRAESGEPKVVRNYYRAIIRDLLAGCDKAYDKLRQLSEKES